MSLITRRKPLLGRLAAALGIALGLAAGSPLAPALAQQQDEARRCPPGEFEGPESCSGRPLISSGARLALQTGPIALPEGHRSQGYSVNVVASVGSTPAESALEGRLPQGLHLEASGNIAGVPQETGVFQFTVTLSDPTTVPTRTSQSYLLRIVGPTTSRPRPDPRPEPKPQRQPQPRPEPYVKKTGEVTIVVYELTSADLSGLIAGPVSSQAVGAQPTGAGGAVAAGAPAANVAPGALGGAGAPATSASTSGAAAAPTPAPANTPTPSRSSRPPTAAQIANVPGAAARALGAPASVAKVAAVPANLARRANSLTAAFRPLRRRGGTSAPEPAPAPAPEPAPAPALPVVVARAPSQAVAELLQIIFSTRDLPVVSVLPAGFAARAGPLISTPFPTRNLFKAALDHAAANAGVRLSPALSEAVTAKARKAVPYSHATPLHWVSQDGCRCNSPPHGADDKIVYGFYPFWRSGPSGPEVMFSRFNRIGLLGAQLQPDGGWVYPSSPQNAADDWWDGLSPFAMTAQAHNVELDLVLQASDWSFLNNPQLNEQALRTLYEQSARKAMQLLDTPLRGRGLRALLAPVWGQPRYVFGGVTVMFEAPSANSTEYAKFTQFNDGFLRELVREMERRKR
ncbi:MAG TPA: Ig domain-containing protein, partial [Phenylobacterium sp.]